MTTPQPGWYDDPQDAGAQRYFDGQQWTSHRQRKPKSVAPPGPTLPPSPTQQPAPAPAPAESPAPPRVKSGRSKVGFVLVGLALVLAVAALVAGRVLLGMFLPGILLVAAIGVACVTLMLRTRQSGRRKAIFVAAVVLVVAVAIPASLKVAYPVYNRLFSRGSAQASGNSPTQVPASNSPSRAPASNSPTQIPMSGILVESGDSWDEATFGYIDPTNGKYTQISSFKEAEPQDEALQVSPDLTKFAVLKTDSTNRSAVRHVGWVDTSGNFTDVTPAA